MFWWALHEVTQILFSVRIFLYGKRGADKASAPRGYGLKKCLLDNLFQFVDVACHVLVGDLEVLEGAGKELVVGAHVDESVAGEVEEDDLLLAGLLAAEGLIDGGGNGVA